jgi:hypothetical protein
MTDFRVVDSADPIEHTQNDDKHDHSGAPTENIELMVDYWSRYYPLKLEIKRKKPHWDQGHIDTLELDLNETVTREDLREIHGGGKIKYILWAPKHQYLGAVTEQYAGPPMRDGVVIHPPKSDEEKKQEKHHLDLIADLQNKNFQIQQQAVQRQIELMQQSLNERLLLEREMRKDLKSVAQSQQQNNSLESLLEQIDSLDALRERLGGGGGAAESTFSPLLMMAQQLFEQQMQSQQQPQIVETPLPPRKPKNKAAKPQPKSSMLAQLMSEISDLPEEQQTALTDMINGQAKNADNSCTDER